MSLLSIEKLSIGFKEALVQDINLELEKGKLVFLLGENGSGKSTFMKTLFKIVPPFAGQIKYRGKDFQEINAKLWSQTLSAVFSRIGVVPMIPVNELIEIGSSQPDMDLKSNVIQLLEIEHLLDKYANEISDGQLQKVMIARALLQNTDFVFFDEPTAHLDFKSKSHVFQLLRNLVDSTEKTFIVITHEILYALEMADEIWYITEGKLYKGSSNEIDAKYQLREQILNLKQNES